MPSSPEALAAAQNYRTSQLAIQAAFLREALVIWPLLDKANVAKTSPVWLQLATALVRRWWAVSATAGLDYYARARTLEKAPGEVRLTLPPALDEQIILRNLLYSGPGELRRAASQGLEPEAAGRRALAASSQFGARLALQGGRDAVDQAVETDPKALGWLRITDGHPCAFCAMLASRGAVYKTHQSAGVRKDPRTVPDDKPPVSHWHPSCGCQVVPVFTRNPSLPSEAKHFDALWVSSTTGLSGDEARIAFRRAVEGR